MTYDFETALKKMPIMIQKLYDEWQRRTPDTSKKPVTIKRLEGIMAGLKEAIFDPLSDIEAMRKTSTATGTDLDKHGARYGVGRNGLNDDDYRTSIYAYISSSTIGSVRSQVQLFIEGMGYVVVGYKKGLNIQFHSDITGASPYCGTLSGNGTIDKFESGAYVMSDKTVNYRFIWILDHWATPAESIEIESAIQPILKVHNFVTAR